MLFMYILVFSKGTIFIYLSNLAPSNYWMGVLWILAFTESDHNVLTTNEVARGLHRAGVGHGLDFSKDGLGLWVDVCVG